jgi:glycosyltransferase involved in cell wall biosynthesis
VKLVFVTQVLDRNDAILGFVSRWVAGLGRRCERVRVIALEVGDTRDLPANVDWRVVGRAGRVARWLRYRGFIHEACAREGFDTLLTHMVPRYSSVAAPWARRLGVGHFLWYTHKGVDARLRKAVAAVDKVFTASPESMRIDTRKKVVTGHGIDLSHFGNAPAPAGAPLLLSAGRLTPAKDPLTVLGALARLRADGHDVRLEWAGGALASGDEAYERAVRARVDELGLGAHARFLGDVPYPEFPAVYRRATLFVSASRTGSVDKVVLEAMASGRPPVTCNEAFPALFAELGPLADGLVYPAGDVDALAARLAALLAQPAAARDALGARLRAIVARDHEVDALMGRLVAEMGAR